MKFSTIKCMVQKLQAKKHKKQNFDFVEHSVDLMKLNQDHTIKFNIQL